MKQWKHISLDQRKVIGSGIAHNYKLKEIAESLSLDPTSLSKEIKRNRDTFLVGKDKTIVKERIDGHLFVLIVTTDIKIVFLQNINTMLNLRSKKHILI